MIELKSLTKNFDGTPAVDRISVDIKENEVFGLIGTNGAGKSTTLRMMAGVIRPDAGAVVVDSMPIFDNLITKQRVFFIADEPYYFQNASSRDMMDYYYSVYPTFDTDRFLELMEACDIDASKKISSFSKGMKKQVSMLLGICSGAKYLLCDETFDGLDPVMKEAIKGLLRSEMKKRELTPIIASHNLRELEDICDHVGLLHKGGVLLSRDLDDMKLNIQKVQFVLGNNSFEDIPFGNIEIIKDEQRGSLHVLTLRCLKEQAEKIFENIDTVFFEVLPLSLEEIFISETEIAGYDMQKIFLD